MGCEYGCAALELNQGNHKGLPYYGLCRSNSLWLPVIVRGFQPLNSSQVSQLNQQSFGTRRFKGHHHRLLIAKAHHR